MKRRILFLGFPMVIMGILISCGHRKVNEDLFSEESFNTRINIRDGRQVVFDELFLGQPSTIKFHPDSFLVIEEMESPMLIKILDLKNNRIQELIPRGRGPGEMLVSRGVTVIGKDIFLFCVQLSKVVILTPRGDRSFVIVNEFFIEEKQTGCFHPLSRNKSVCLSTIGDDKRFTLLNGNGKVIKKFGEYPSFLNDDEIKADNDIFHSVISSTPDGEQFIAVCLKTDIFEIYNVEAGLKRRFQGPLGLKISVEAQSMGTGYMLRPQPHYLTYRPLIAGKSEFWAGFIGHRWQPGKDAPLAEQCTNKIYCFDWKGKPLRSLSLEYPAISFDVDWEGKVLYILELRQNDPVIASYTLNNSLY